MTALALVQHPVEAPGVGDRLIDHQRDGNQFQAGQNTEAHNTIIKINIEAKNEKAKNKNTLEQGVGLERIEVK